VGLVAGVTVDAVGLSVARAGGYLARGENYIVTLDGTVFKPYTGTGLTKQNGGDNTVFLGFLHLGKGVGAVFVELEVLRVEQTVLLLFAGNWYGE
jgi:hypothetical protein